MTKIKSDPGIVKATSEGKLYVKSSDFFSLEKVKETIYKLKNSQLIKDLDNKKASGN